MSKVAKLTVVDQVNICLTGVEPRTHKALEKAFRIFDPKAPFTPKYQSKRWDGYFKFYKDGWTFVNLIDDEFLGILDAHGYEIDLVDRRDENFHDLKPIDENYFAEFFDKTGKPFKLRDYQVFAANETITNNTGIFELATGAGKSSLCAAIAKQFRTLGKVMVLVPSVDLVVQTAKEFRSLGIEKVGEFYADEKIVEDVTITTWQSLSNYPEILEGVRCLLGDEVHKLQADIVHKILTTSAKNVPFRFGFTATLPKEQINFKKLLSSFGKVLFRKKSWELQEEGVLASCHVHVLQYMEDDGDKLNEQFEKDYAAEYKYLVNKPNRLRDIAGRIQKASEKGNTLVLCKNIATCSKLAALIEGAVAMTGSASAKKRKSEFNNIQVGTNGVLICTVGIASTGIDIPSLRNVFMVDPGKDFKTILQSIGRAIRKTADKDFADVFDVCSNLTFSKKHLRERKKTYTEAKYPFDVTPIYYN